MSERIEGGFMAHITFVLGFCNKYNLNKLKVCDL